MTNLFSTNLFTQKMFTFSNCPKDVISFCQKQKIKKQDSINANQQLLFTNLKILMKLTIILILPTTSVTSLSYWPLKKFIIKPNYENEVF